MALSSAQLTIRQGSILEFRYDRNPQRSAIVNAANQVCLGGGGLDAAINQAGGPQLQKDRQALPVLRNHNTRNEVRCPKGEARHTGPGNYGSLQVPYVIHAVGADYRLVSHVQQGDDMVESAYRSSLALAEQLHLEAIAFPLLSTGAFRGNQGVEEIIKIGMKVIQSFPVMHLKHIYVYAFDTRDFALLQSVVQELSLAPNEISYSISQRPAVAQGHASVPPQLPANVQQSAPPAPSAPCMTTITADLSNMAVLPPPFPSAPPATAPGYTAPPATAPGYTADPSAPPPTAPGYNAAVYVHNGGSSPSPLRSGDIAQLKLLEGNFHALIRHEAQKHNVPSGFQLPNLIDLASRDNAPIKGEYFAIQGMNGGYDTQLMYDLKSHDWTISCTTWIKGDQGSRPKHSISKDGIQSSA